VSEGEKILAEVRNNAFSVYSISVRSRRDLIVARHLLDAIAESERRNFAAAEKAVETARHLAPEYHEVHRVTAFVKIKQGNYPAGRDAYEAAIELEPRSAPLRLAYAHFFWSCLNETDRALEQLQEGLRIEPDSIDLQLEGARIHLYSRRFDEARAILDSLLQRLGSMTRWNHRTITYDFDLQYFTRRADDLVVSGRDYLGALELIERLLAAYGAIPESRLDDRMRFAFLRQFPQLNAVRMSSEGQNWSSAPRKLWSLSILLLEPTEDLPEQSKLVGND
jgi:tetratricopeptide (TPR) repeat protein